MEYFENGYDSIRQELKERENRVISKETYRIGFKKIIEKLTAEELLIMYEGTLAFLSKREAITEEDLAMQIIKEEESKKEILRRMK